MLENHHCVHFNRCTNKEGLEICTIAWELLFFGLTENCLVQFGFLLESGLTLIMFHAVIINPYFVLK